MESGKIYKAIPAIMAEVGAIGKNRTNTGQNYKFRGIDDFYNTCHPLMVKHSVFSTSDILDQKREERPAKSGGILIWTVLTVLYTFYCDDGSHVTTKVIGEGMDSGDKSSNKAMAGAHKYALAQLFSVPTEDLVDSELDNPDPAPKGTQPAPVAQKPAPQKAATPAQKPAAAPVSAAQKPLMSVRIKTLKATTIITPEEHTEIDKMVPKLQGADLDRFITGWEKDVAERTKKGAAA